MYKRQVVFLKFRDIEMRQIERAWTILYSLLEGLSRALNIDRKELSGCIQWYRDNSTPMGNFGCILSVSYTHLTQIINQLQY